MYESLLSPGSICVIGVSQTPGKVGYEIFANLVNGGFKGDLFPVNPKATVILDHACFPDISFLPESPDLAVIAVPTAAVKPAVEASLKKGVGAIIVITAGFKETGKEGAELELEIAQLCRKKNVPLMGPNCLGLVNTQHAMNASFASRMPGTGEISVISQSGALCTAILDWAAERHLGLAKLASIGNKAGLDERQFLTAFAEDESTHVIVGYLESISEGNDFIRIAKSVASRKPVVILKVGSTEAGGKAASSHTGSLAGADVAYGAAFKQAGVIRAENFEHLFDVATALAMQPLPAGDHVAIITNAGGPGIMAADAVENSGMTVAKLSGKSAQALTEKLPSAASVANPIDVLGDADPERYGMALDIAQNDPTVDAIIVILTPQAMTKPAETARAIAKRVCGEKPVLAVFMGGRDVMPGREELVESKLPDYTSPERAVAALKAMRSYALWRARPPRVVSRFPVNRRRVERILSRQARTRGAQLGEVRTKEILRAYDFNVPAGQMVTNSDEAVEFAEHLGFPLAMKIVSPDIIHKSDLGGVRIGLGSAEEVRDAFDLMILRIGRRLPEARIDGVYIEQMCKRGREVIVGMTRDPQFGPMLMFGLGGIFVEVMKDVTFHLAPITKDEAMQMLRGTRSYALLEGARGQGRVDIGTIAQGLQRISQLVTDFPQIRELDINPLIVGPVGTEPAVADARITLSVEGADNE